MHNYTTKERIICPLLQPRALFDILLPCYSKNMISEENQKNIADIARREGVRLVYLFGSQAHGTSHNESDVDIAVLLSEHSTKEQRFNTRLRLAGEISQLLNVPVDLVILNDTSSLFLRYVIITEGVMLHAESDDQRITYESATMASYFDFQPFLAEYHQHYVKTHL